MADDGLRELERVGLSGDLGASLTYASRVGRFDKSACHETLCDVLGSDRISGEQFGEAEQMFRGYFGGMHVVDQGDCWRMSYFTDDGGFVDETLDKQLLDGGEKYEQRVGVEGLQRIGRDMQGSQDFCDLAIACYLNRNHVDPVQRGFINDVYGVLRSSVSGGNWLMTKSRARYCSQEKDLFIPRYDFALSGIEQQGSELVLVGDHYDITAQNLFAEVTKVVTRTSDGGLVDEVFTDLGGLHPRVWRLGQKPRKGQEDAERVVVLDVDSNVFVVLNDVIVSYGGCALGWSRRTQKFFPQEIGVKR